MKHLLIAIATLFSVSLVNSQTINTGESQVKFTIDNGPKKQVEGIIKGMKGEVKFNESDLSNSKMSVCIDPSTVDTKSGMRDKHLNKDDFFGVEKFPSICFESSDIKSEKGNFKAKGKLTMLGVSKEIEIPFTYEDGIFKGTFELERLDYKLGPESDKMIGFSVKIEIICKLK